MAGKTHIRTLKGDFLDNSPPGPHTNENVPGLPSKLVHKFPTIELEMRKCRREGGQMTLDLGSDT